MLDLNIHNFANFFIYQFKGHIIFHARRMVFYLWFSLYRLQPDEDSARQKIQRSNYQAYLMRNPELRDHPTPVGRGWVIENGVCRPHRYSKPALPELLHEINQNTENETDMDTTGDNNDDTENSDSDNEVISGGDDKYDDIDIYDISDEDTSDED